MTDVKRVGEIRSTREHPHLGVLLARARRIVDGAILEALHGAGFTDLRDAHEAVFAFLPGTGTTLTELARRARMTKQSMGELVRDLEGLGYVERVPDPNDRRAKIITFTEKGRRADEVGVRAVLATEAGWRRRYGAQRVGEVRALLEELTGR
jgi:DNA-binding MarR family transcriptional regulator